MTPLTLINTRISEDPIKEREQLTVLLVLKARSNNYKPPFRLVCMSFASQEPYEINPDWISSSHGVAGEDEDFQNHRRHILAVWGGAVAALARSSARLEEKEEKKKAEQAAAANRQKEAANKKKQEQDEMAITRKRKKDEEDAAKKKRKREDDEVARKKKEEDEVTKKKQKKNEEEAAKKKKRDAADAAKKQAELKESQEPSDVEDETEADVNLSIDIEMKDVPPKPLKNVTKRSISQKEKEERETPKKVSPTNLGPGKSVGAPSSSLRQLLRYCCHRDSLCV